MLGMFDYKFINISETQRILLKIWIAFILQDSILLYNRDEECSVYRVISNNINRYQI